MVGPMEKVGVDWKDTTMPGLYLADYGQGKLAYIPWDLGDLYYRYSPVSSGLGRNGPVALV
jgi:hypothetical protein